MSPLIAGHIVIGTVCLTVGLIHLMIGLRKKKAGTDILFAVMAICIAAGMYLDIGMYRAATVGEFNRVFKIHVSFDVIFWISTIWFIRFYTGTARRPLLLLPTVCYAAAQDPPVQSARGIVFADQNHNGIRDPGEPGLPEVRVSNGETELMSTTTFPDDSPSTTPPGWNSTAATSGVSGTIVMMMSAFSATSLPDAQAIPPAWINSSGT